MNRKLTLILALLVLALVSVSIVAAVNETPDQMAADDDSDDKMSQDNDDEKITADDKPVVGVIEFPVKIVWEDNVNNAGKRPSSVIVIVNAGENTWELELTDVNDWRGEAAIIPDADADSISVQDVHVDGYTTKIVGNPKDGYEITCTYIDDSNDNSTDTDDDNQNDPADDDTDEADDDNDPQPKDEVKVVKKTTTTTKEVPAKKEAKKEPKKTRDKHNTGNPVLLGVLAVSLVGLAYTLRRKE